MRGRLAAALCGLALISSAGACQAILGIEDLAPGASSGNAGGAGGSSSEGGGGSGPCTPVVEDCSTPADDNCDGKTTCTGEQAWIRMVETFASPDDTFAGAVAIDPELDVLVTGLAVGRAFLDGLGPTSVSNDKLFGYVAKLSHADGKPLWFKTFAASGALAQVVPVAVAATVGGDVVVGGYFGGTFQGENGHAQSGFVMLLDGKDGKVAWMSAQLAGTDSDHAEIANVTVASDGAIVAVGDATGAVTLPNGDPLGYASAGGNGFVLLLDKQGTVVNSAVAPAGRGVYCSGVAVEASSGDVLMGCTYSGTGSSVAGKDLPDIVDEHYDGFVARLTGDLTLKWATPLASTDEVDMANVGFGTDGQAIVAGAFVANLAIDESQSTSDTADGPDPFVAALDASGGPLWIKHFGAGVGVTMAVDEAGQIVFGGDFSGKIQADDCSISSKGGASEERRDAFVLKLSPSGHAIWCKGGGGPDFIEATLGVAADRLGNVYAAASVSDSLSFGTETATCARSRCTHGLAIARLAP